MHTITWVDFIMLAILGFGINSARKSDLFTELIILFGVLFAACFSLHYYVRLGFVLDNQFVLPPNSDDALAFLIIAGFITGLTLLIKGGWLVILKVKLNKDFDNWGSIILAFFKSVFICSLVIFGLSISGHPTFESDAKKSYSFVVFHKPALWVYNVGYSGFIGPFFKEEPFNESAFRAMQ